MSDILASSLQLIGVLAVTAIAAVFVSAEYSLTTLEGVQVDAHEKAVGDRRAKRVRQAQHTLSFQLSGAQLGITLTGLVTGTMAEPAVAGLLRPLFTAMSIPLGVATPIAAVLSVLLATALSVIFGELVPKNLAIARALPVARAVAGMQWWFSWILRWFIRGLNGAANWIVRRLGVEPAEELRSARNPAELGSVVRSSAAQGTLDQGTAALLDRSLRFGERTADELMTPRMRVESLKLDATVDDLIAATRRTGFSRFPVHEVDMDDVRGAVHVKQAFSVPARQRASTPLSALVRPVPTVPSSLEGDALLDRLRDSGLQLALVVDEWGGSAGIVTLEDLVEEIVGDVRDEHDRGEVNPVRPLGRESWMVSGLLRDDEVAEATGFRMPEGEYETLAGMVVDRFGRIPSVGEEVRIDGWRITVMRMDRLRVAELRVARER
ncbi:hemolysin family protein [Sciscionella sediminilitoris]|uniref:hemolysin family protein n=1 Tax=Sciscionella sediminilitoris TaxID=1445613 RepID=UPI0004DFC940|nr:hemolysin family protein [Sciscionella sp. SE31]